jgi:sporulation protein YlmC with PRC-barrel domain
MRKYPALAICMATAFTTCAAFAQNNTGAAKDQSPAETSVSTQRQGSSDHSSSLLNSDKQMEMGCIRASKLIGVNVSDKDGTNLGQVQDLIMDPSTGRIRYALVGQGFMAGAGQTLFPVPWHAVNVQSEKQFVLNVDHQKLKNAPAWSETQIEQPDYQLRIFRFYDLEPKAEMGGPGQSGQQSGQGKGSSSDEKSDAQHNASEQHSQQSTAPDK